MYIESTELKTEKEREWNIDIKKGNLSNGLHCLPRLQEIVAPVATANLMVPHAVPKLKKCPLHSHVHSLNIDIHGSNLIRILIHLLHKLASLIFYMLLTLYLYNLLLLFSHIFSLYFFWEIMCQTCVMIITIKSMFNHELQSLILFKYFKTKQSKLSN